MIFRQLFDSKSSTYTYLLGDPDTRQALLIDPVFEQYQRDAALLRELGLKLEYTLDTHVHADHVTSAWLLKQKLGSAIVSGARSGAEGADRYVRDGDVIECGSVRLAVRETPGHTGGCLTYVTEDLRMAFTGDALLVRGAGRTDFQEGDAATLYRSVKTKILSLPDDCELYPAHDYQGRTSTSVAEEKAHNPRLGGSLSESDFVGFMSNLNLPHPKQIDAAVPANLRCGMPEDGKAPAEPDWAPLYRTYAGHWEVDAGWVEEHRHELQIVDVRKAEEFNGELGHIPGAKLVPLEALDSSFESLDRQRPVVAVCRAGGRSARAAQMLEKAGFERSANLHGGMIEWRSRGLATE